MGGRGGKGVKGEVDESEAPTHPSHINPPLCIVRPLASHIYFVRWENLLYAVRAHPPTDLNTHRPTDLPTDPPIYPTAHLALSLSPQPSPPSHINTLTGSMATRTLTHSPLLATHTPSYLSLSVPLPVCPLHTHTHRPKYPPTH